MTTLPLFIINITILPDTSSIHLAFTTWQIILLLAVILLIFGAKKIPDIARSIGAGLKEFKKATKDIREDVEDPYRTSAQPSIHHRIESEPLVTNTLVQESKSHIALNQVESMILSRTDLSEQQKVEMIDQIRRNP